MVTARSATTAVLLAGLAVHGSKLAYDTQHLKGFYTERICGTVFTDRCYEASSRIVCGENYCAQLAPYHGVLDLKDSWARGKRDTLGARVISGGFDQGGFDQGGFDAFQPFCGATLISEQWLVTAAHCVHTNRQGNGYCSQPDIAAEECGGACPQGCHRVLPGQLQVYLGLTDVTKLEKAQAYDVEAIVVHPGWELSSMDNNILGGHDIALIKLSREVLLSDTAWPACLPDPLLTQGLAEVGAEATVVGFGVTNTTTHASADILQRAMIHVVAPDRCQMPEGASALASSFRWQIGGDQICAKGEDILGDSPCFRDSCQGDSGGALISTNYGRRFIIGVVSFGETYCGGLNNPRPGVYTNVTSHVQWIRDVTDQIEAGEGQGWSAWSAWATCSVSCGVGQQTRTRTCSRLGRASEPVLGHVVGAQCHDGETVAVQNCDSGPCPARPGPVPVMGPGVQIIQGISGIFGGISNVFLGMQPTTPRPPTFTPPPSTSRPVPPPTQWDLGLNLGAPSAPVPVQEALEGVCSMQCNDWPYSQCKVQLTRRDGSWQAASCLHPYMERPGPATGWMARKFSNYPECGNIPLQCGRCDGHCARLDGRVNKEDY